MKLLQRIQKFCRKLLRKQIVPVNSPFEAYQNSDQPLTIIEDKNIPLPVLRDKMLALEMLLLKLPQIEIPPVHRFTNGLYSREVTVPKGTLLTGEIHTSGYMTIVSKGDISVLSDDGTGTKRIKAPFAFVSTNQVKRVAYAHEDTVWTTIHAVSETDVSKVEDEIFDRTYTISEDRAIELLLEMPIQWNEIKKLTEGTKLCQE